MNNNSTTPGDRSPDLPSFSQFYTTSIDNATQRSSSTYLQQLADALAYGQDSWPEGSEYVIVDAIAVGGMGAILLARDDNAGRKVAMKMMLRADTETPAAKRFVREARIVASLEHPNIVPVHDIGDSPLGDPYFTMKWVQGENLADILYKIRQRVPEYLSKFTLPVLLEIFVKVCNGVAFAHSRKIVHLDLKPHNILVGDYGDVLVSDWGLAAIRKQDGSMDGLASSEESEAIRTLSEKAIPYDYRVFTEDGTIKGTPGFMAPEQADGKLSEIDERSDVFSLGSILYMILTQHYPIIGENFSEILRHTIAGNFVPPGQRTHYQRVSAELEAVVMKAMSLEKEDRYDSVDQLQEDISAYLIGYATSVESGNVIKQLQRFVRRWKTEVTLVTASAAIILLLFVIFSIKLDRLEEKTREEERNNKEILEHARLATSEARKNRILATRNIIEATEAKYTAGFSKYLASLRLCELSLNQLRYTTLNRGLEECPANFRHWEWGRYKLLASLNHITLEPQYQPVALGVNTNGNLIAAITRDNRIVAWDSSAGQVAYEVKFGTPSLTAMAVSGDAATVVYAQTDNNAEIWNVDSQSIIGKLTGHNTAINALSISKFGEVIATASEDGLVILWDGKTQTRLRSLKGKEGSVTCMTLNTDGTRLVTGGRKGVYLWNCKSGKLLQSLKEQETPVTAVAYDETKRLIVAGNESDILTVWDGATGLRSHRFQTGHKTIHDIDISDDGKLMVTCGSDSLIRLWDLDTGTMVHLMRGHTGPVRNAYFGRSVDEIVSLGDDGKIKIWTVPDFSEPRLLGANHSGTAPIVIGPKDQLAASTIDNNSVSIWSLVNGEAVLTLTDFASVITSVCFSRDGEDLITSTDDNRVVVWKLKTGRERLILRGHKGTVTNIGVGHDQRRIITGSTDGTARIWDGVNGRELAVLSGHIGPVTQAAISGDGEVAVTSGEDNTVRIWAPASGAQIRALDQSLEEITTFALSADSAYIAVGYQNGVISVYDQASGRQIHRIKGHRSEITAIWITSDQKRIISGSADATVKVWDLDTAAEMAVLTAHNQAVSSVVMTSDSRRMITADAGGKTLLWNSSNWRN